MSNGIHRKCSKCCITKRIRRAHHMLLWHLLEGRLVGTEGIGLLLSYCCHLHSRRGSETAWQSKWILHLKRIRSWCPVNWLLCGSICCFIVQTVQSKRVQSTSLTFIGRMRQLKSYDGRVIHIHHGFDYIGNFWLWVYAINHSKSSSKNRNQQNLPQEIWCQMHKNEE